MANKKKAPATGTETIELGDEAKDVITGFRGVVVAVTKWLHGCERVTLQPRTLLDNGTPIEARTFDAPQLVLVKKGAAKGTSHTGGPRPEPQRRETPSR